MFWDAKRMEEQRKAEREKQEKARQEREAAKKLAKKVAKDNEVKRKKLAEGRFNTDYGELLDPGVKEPGEGDKGKEGLTNSAITRGFGGGSASRGYLRNANRTPLPGTRPAPNQPGAAPRNQQPCSHGSRFQGNSGTARGGNGESFAPKLNRKLG